MSRVIILSGPKKSGKTSLAKLIAKNISPSWALTNSIRELPVVGQDCLILDNVLVTRQLLDRAKAIDSVLIIITTMEKLPEDLSASPDFPVWHLKELSSVISQGELERG